MVPTTELWLLFWTALDEDTVIVAGTMEEAIRVTSSVLQPSRHGDVTPSPCSQPAPPPVSSFDSKSQTSENSVPHHHSKVRQEYRLDKAVETRNYLRLFLGIHFSDKRRSEGWRE